MSEGFIIGRSSGELKYKLQLMGRGQNLLGDAAFSILAGNGTVADSYLTARPDGSFDLSMWIAVSENKWANLAAVFPTILDFSQYTTLNARISVIKNGISSTANTDQRLRLEILNAENTSVLAELVPFNKGALAGQQISAAFDISGIDAGVLRFYLNASQAARGATIRIEEIILE